MSGFELHRNGITQSYILLYSASLIQYRGIHLYSCMRFYFDHSHCYAVFHNLYIYPIIDTYMLGGFFLRFLMGKHCYEYFYISFGGTWGVILELFRCIGYIFYNFEWNLKLLSFLSFQCFQYSFINSWEHPLYYMFYVKSFPNSASRDCLNKWPRLKLLEHITAWYRNSTVIK